MKALITGGAGFIGSYLAEELIRRGYDVVVLDNLSTGKLGNISHLEYNPSFEFVTGSILDEYLVAKLVRRVDCVFHLAAAVGVRLIIEQPVNTIQTNILGTETVLKAASNSGKKVIFTSSSEVYGKNDETPFSEEDNSVYGPTVKSRWSYACSKAAGEFLSLAYYSERKTPVLILRLFNTIGQRQTGRYGMVVPRFVGQALAGSPITVFGDGTQSRCFVNVKDVVWAAAELSESARSYGQVFNIGGRIGISIKDLAEKIRGLCNSSSKIQFIPYDQAFTKGFEDMYRRTPDITKTEKAIGYKPRYSLQDTIEEVRDYHMAAAIASPVKEETRL